jgi:hypothetical protein
MKRYAGLCILLLLVQGVLGQFTNVAAIAGISLPDQQVHAGVSFYDFNKDGWDDITLGITFDSVYFYVNEGNGGFSLEKVIPNDSFSKAPVWADYDNDGDADFMLAREYGSCVLFRNDGDMVFTDVTAALPQPSSQAMSQCISWADYDRDGWLDVYIGNWDQSGDITNWLFRNNGDGTFSDVTIQAGVGDGMRSTLGCIFFDYNFDLWPDLFVANDKDLGNALYKNNGDGTFSDVTTLTNAGQMINSMCASVSDFDNDGDWDIYVSNDFVGNVLLQYEDGVFTDIAPESGTATYNDCWASLWIDYNNNLWEDLYVATASVVSNNRDYFFSNNGDQTFTQMQSILQVQAFNKYSYSSAKGDFDNDFDWDMAMYYQNPSSLALFRNDSQVLGNAIKLTLEGTVSNRDGVGALIEYYLEGTKKIVATFCGENYISQDSQHELLSMSEHAQIDSLIITWPSGWVDSYFNLENGNHYYVYEGQTFQPSVETHYELCENASMLIDGGDYSQWNWNTGDTTRYVEVAAAGNYLVTVVNEFGIQADVDITVVTLEGGADVVETNLLCNGDQSGRLEVIELDVPIDSVQWENGSSELLLDSLIAGNYSLTIYYANGCAVDASLALTEPEEMSLITVPDAICTGDTVSLAWTVLGGTGFVVADWGTADPNAITHGTYTVLLTDELNCTDAADVVIDAFPEIEVNVVSSGGACDNALGSIDIDAWGGTPPFTYAWYDADALETGITQEDPMNLACGWYYCVVNDANGCQAQSAYVELFSIGLEEKDFSRPSVYPNPCDGEIFVNATGAYALFDTSGREVFSGIHPDRFRPIEVAGLSEGFYVLKINEIRLPFLRLSH